MDRRAIVTGEFHRSVLKRSRYLPPSRNKSGSVTDSQTLFQSLISIPFSKSARRDKDNTPMVSSPKARKRSEEQTSELQSLRHLVCRLLLEKKNDDVVDL